MYDTVNVDGHWEQTKALGKGLCVFGLGDTVSVYPAPMDEEQLSAYYEGTLAPVDVATFQVQTETGWAIAQNHILVGWLETPFEGIPMFDYLGRRIPGEVSEQFSG